MNELKDHADPNIVILMVGNKLDLKDTRVNTEIDPRLYAVRKPRKHVQVRGLAMLRLLPLNQLMLRQHLIE